MGTVINSGLNTGQLSTVIHELNISRNYISAYPKGHPVILSSCEKLSLQFGQLLDFHEELKFGITKDSLVIHDYPLGQGNFAFRDFAAVLFHHGIAVITFRRGLTSGDFVKFNEILLEKREHIREKGGIEQAIMQAGIQGIRISEVCYDSFQLIEQSVLSPATTPGPASSPWELFVHRLLTPHSESCGIISADIDPQFLAETINDLFGHGSLENGNVFSESLLAFLTELVTSDLNPAAQKDFFRKMGAFASHLNPDLLKQFIVTAVAAFTSKGLNCTENTLGIRDKALWQLGQAMDSGAPQLPPLIKNLVDVLSKHAGGWPDASVSPLPIHNTDDDEMRSKLMLLFREDRTGEFVPPQYLGALSLIVNSESFLGNHGEDPRELAEALEDNSIDRALGNIIFEIMGSPLNVDLEKLKQKLLDIFNYHLQTGDYESLIHLHDRAVQSLRSRGDAATQECLAFFEKEDFVAEILNGLVTWGKDKYADIGRIIQKIGKPFIEPLLDRLADEQNLSVRRYYMSHLVKLAETAKEPVIRRLGDSRWYVLRNLLIILRHSEDPGVMQYLGGLAGHPHPKVRLKVLKIYQHFTSPEADLLLLQEMQNPDMGVRISAIQLAGKSTGPGIGAHLLALIQRRGFTADHLAVKRAVVGALADRGDRSAIPVFEAILRKSRYFVRFRLAQLQIDIINSLDRYRDESALRLLQKTAHSGDRLLSRTATDKLRAFTGKVS